MKGLGRIRTRAFAGQVLLNEVPLDVINYFVPDALPLVGAVTTELNLSGTLQAPRGEGRVQFHDAGYDNYRLGRSEFTIQADTEIARVTGRVLDDVKVLASIPTEPGLDAEVTLSFDGFSVERWLPQMGELPLASELTGDVKASFNPFEGSFGEATAEISRLVAQYDVLSDARYLLETREALTVSYRDQLIDVERLDAGIRLLGNRNQDEQAEEESFVVVGGTATTGGTLDLSYRGTLGLQLIQPFVRGIFSQASGQLSVHGKLTGMPDELVPTADLVLESAELVPRVSLIGAQL